MNHKILFCLIFLLYCNLCCGQHQYSESISVPPDKNTVYATLGVYPDEFYGTIMINYERMIIHLPESWINSFWVRAGAGPWVWWSGKGINFTTTVSMLTGRKGVHLETGAGFLLTYDSYAKKFDPLIRDRYLAGNVGFRFQKPGKTVVIRAGIGWPEYLYLSLGFDF